MPKKTTADARRDILIEAFLTCPNVTQVSDRTGIPRSTVYKVLKQDDFQEKLAEARQEAVNNAVSYMQGNLSECAETLMSIVRNEKLQPQIRINAINSVFAGVKGFSKDNRETLAGMAVKIIDSI